MSCQSPCYAPPPAMPTIMTSGTTAAVARHVRPFLVLDVSHYMLPLLTIHPPTDHCPPPSLCFPSPKPYLSDNARIRVPSSPHGPPSLRPPTPATPPPQTLLLKTSHHSRPPIFPTPPLLRLELPPSPSPLTLCKLQEAPPPPKPPASHPPKILFRRVSLIA